MNSIIDNAVYWISDNFTKNVGTIALLSTTLLIFGHYVLKNSVKQSQNRAIRVTRNIAVIFITLFFVIAIGIHPERSLKLHYLNLSGLMLFIWLAGLLRTIINSLDLMATGRKANKVIIQNIRDTIWNTVMFFGIYAAIMYAQNDMFRWSGYLLCVFIILRMFRFLRKPERNISVHGVTQNPNINLLLQVFNLVMRSYLYITVSYGCIYSLMYFGNNNSDQPWFKYESSTSSGSVLFDFIYFSIITLSTVGYGDISPINWMPKLLSITEILIGYMFIGTLMAMILIRYDPK